MSPPVRRIAAWISAVIGTLVVCWSMNYAPTRDLGVVKDTWFTISHAVTNSFHTWAIVSPLLWCIERFAPAPSLSTRDCCWIFTIPLYLGSLALVRRIRERSGQQLRWSEPILLALTLAAWLQVVGCDLVAISTLAFFPFLLLALDTILLRDGIFARGVALLFVAFIFHLFTAFQLSVVTVPTLIAAAVVLSGSGRAGWEMRGDESSRLPRLLLWLCLPAVLLAYFAPVASFPTYAPGTHLVPDDGVPGVIRPMFGPEYSLPVINRQATKLYYWWSCVLSLVLIAGSWGLVKSRSSRSILLISSVLLILAAGDVLLPESLALILPGQSLPRIVPGLFFFALTPLLFHCGVLLMILGVTASSLRFAPAFALGGVVAMVGVVRSGGLPTPPDFLSSASPSLAAAQAMAYSAGQASIDLARFKALSVQQSERVVPSAVEFSTNVEQGRDSLRRMLDHRPETRWSSGAGRQLGGEELVVRFMTPQLLDGLVLDPGVFKADFPRGLVVEQCDGSPQVLAAHPSWQGAVVFTEDGLPAFTGQQHVRVLFPATTTVQCLRIKQVGRSPHFDWSVAEFEVLRSKER